MTAERRGEEVAAVEDRGGGAGGREERAVPDDAAGARARWRALDDRALVLAVRRDDPRALEEYIERYRPLLLRQARRSGLPEGERDDIVLDLLVRTAAQLARGDAAIPRS
ncbi:MAG TPA: hypothetical protein VFS05_01665, partial [Gemmatimonadaceae bacterium]|nr:hypothetical protein [Gemmatimonadaceae bacterium]